MEAAVLTDRVETDKLTHEFLSIMLAVRRAAPLQVFANGREYAEQIRLTHTMRSINAPCVNERRNLPW